MYKFYKKHSIKMIYSKLLLIFFSLHAVVLNGIIAIAYVYILLYYLCIINIILNFQWYIVLVGRFLIINNKNNISTHL